MSTMVEVLRHVELALVLGVGILFVVGVLALLLGGIGYLIWKRLNAEPQYIMVKRPGLFKRFFG